MRGAQTQGKRTLLKILSLKTPISSQCPIGERHTEIQHTLTRLVTVSR